MDQPSANNIKKPKSAPRRNLDARREQNRLASRNYREKRKQKLALLNELLETENTGPTGASFVSEDTNENQDQNASLQANTVGSPGPPPYQGDMALDLGFTGLHESIIPIGIELDQHHVLMSNNWPTSMTSIDSTMTTNTLHTLLETSPLNTLVPNNDSTRPTLLPPAIPSFSQSTAESGSSSGEDDVVRGILKATEQLSFHQKRGLIQLLQHQLESTQSPQLSTPGPQHSILSYDGACLPNRTRLQLEALEFSIALRLTATAGPKLGPSEYAKNTGLFSALFANCFALGMQDIEPLLVEDGWSIFGLGPEIPYHSSQLSVVRAQFRNLAPDLQPCDKQLTFAHHPYIDVIPYKVFRGKILEALDHDPPLLDEDVLCHDMLSGLVCWGSRQNTRGMGAAVPWDARSWEPSVWFLKKYHNFVGGWDDDMWKGARWWHSMRGERMQDSSMTAPS